MPKSPKTPVNPLWAFYIEGRENRLTLAQEGEVDLDANKIAADLRDRNPSVLTAGLGRHIHTSVELEVAHLRSQKAKREWIDDNLKAIKKAGVDQDDAYAAYLQGRIDETVYALEEDVATIISD